MGVNKARHDYFSSVSRGLDWGLFPMRLYELGKRLSWDPAKIDLARDKEDWGRLTDDERDMVIQLASLFGAGEEAVSLDIAPLLFALGREGFIEDVLYLAQFQFEEARHVEAFRRFLDAVGVRDDLSGYTLSNESYRRLFYEELPSAMQVLLEDPSPQNLVRAATTYNMVVEGVLAETGYRVYRDIYRSRGVLPGLVRVINWIATDESRHIAYGTYLISRLVAEHGEEMYKAFVDRMSELTPLAIGVVEGIYNRYSPPYPFGIGPNVFLEYGYKLMGTRFSVVERARGMSPRQVYYMHLRELDVVEDVTD